MTMGTILGYDFADIVRAQQGGRLARTVDTSKPVTHEVTAADRELLARYGSVQSLKEAGFFGTADRIERNPNLT